VILYLDTSALIKLYVRERGSVAVRSFVADADVVATSVVAYAEARAALARLVRERPRRGARHRERVAQLDEDWELYARVELTASVVLHAGDCAERFHLRGFDAIHLASALWLKSVNGGPLLFSAFDRTLTDGARAAGLEIPRARARRRRRSG
jgi:predicted nucleic acid-binding protein